MRIFVLVLPTNDYIHRNTNIYPVVPLPILDLYNIIKKYIRRGNNGCTSLVYFIQKLIQKGILKWIMCHILGKSHLLFSINLKHHNSRSNLSWTITVCPKQGTLRHLPLGCVIHTKVWVPNYIWFAIINIPIHFNTLTGVVRSFLLNFYQEVWDW